MSDESVNDNEEATRGRHAARERDGGPGEASSEVADDTGPGGMAASGTQSEGGGDEDGGRHHTGWGPTDGQENQENRE